VARSIRPLIVVLCVFAAATGFAQEETAEERLQRLEKQLAEQRAINEQQRILLEEMQAELARLRFESAGPATAAEFEDTAETAEVEAEAEETVVRGLSLKISGWMNLDTIYDFDRVAPDYEETLVPTTIPTVPGLYGSDGNFIFSVKQSKLSFVSEGDTPLGHVLGWFEFDLFGTGSNAGQTTFNLRHAWIELGRFGAGQTWSTFMDISTWPNVFDWWGPSAMALNRNAQLRYTVPYGDRGSHFAVALEKQNGSFNVGILDELAPSLAEDLTPKTEFPDLILRWRTEHDWGHFQIAGVARHLAWETLDSPDNRPKDHTFGWGFNLTGILNTTERDRLKLGLTFGEGIASFINDGGGSNLAPVFLAPGADVVAQKSIGFLAYYDHYWSDKWSSAVGMSHNDISLTNLQLTDQPKNVTYASTNLFFTHSPFFIAGIEALYGRLENADGSTGRDFRLQLTTRYIFAHTVFAR